MVMNVADGKNNAGFMNFSSVMETSCCFSVNKFMTPKILADNYHNYL